MQYETDTKTKRGKTTNFKTITLECVIDVLPLIIFFIFFHPGHSYSNLQPINYWEKFLNQKNFLKQYTHANFFFSLAKGMASSVLCFIL